jgi:hypothetical protein
MPSFNEAFNLVPSGYTGLNYQEREQLKGEGSKKIVEGTNIEEKAEGLKLIIKAHYYRSLESAMVNKIKDHSDFEEYICHWLYANYNSTDLDLKDYLIIQYPTPKNPRIEKGRSYWE